VVARGKGHLHGNPTGGVFLDEATQELHQRYHQETLDYTTRNIEWVQNKGFAVDELMPGEGERDQVWRASRKRLFRFPHVEARDMHRVEFSDQAPQRFVREGVDPEAAGDPGDNIFVVNLPRRPTKLRHALEQLHGAGVNAVIIDGVDGDAFVCQRDMDDLGVSTLPNYCGHANTLPYLTSGQLGCFMSHFAVWQHMVDNNVASALILEDDFDLQENFAARLGQYLEEAHAHGEDWNLMYLGRSPTEGDWRVVSEHIVEPGYTLWTVGYLLKLEVAKAFVEGHVERRLAPLDHYFSVAMGKGLDLHWNEQALEWAKHIPQVMRGLAVRPPLVMPWAGSMFLSDTAMMRKGTKYMKDLPVERPETPVWTPGIGMGPDAPKGF
jgi:GR25 family glycosyltransferase involved in LPS biosynthesis